MIQVGVFDFAKSFRNKNKLMISWVRLLELSLLLSLQSTSIYFMKADVLKVYKEVSQHCFEYKWQVYVSPTFAKLFSCSIHTAMLTWVVVRTRWCCEGGIIWTCRWRSYHWAASQIRMGGQSQSLCWWQTWKNCSCWLEVTLRNHLHNRHCQLSEAHWLMCVEEEGQL